MLFPAQSVGSPMSRWTPSATSTPSWSGRWARSSRRGTTPTSTCCTAIPRRSGRSTPCPARTTPATPTPLTSSCAGRRSSLARRRAAAAALGSAGCTFGCHRGSLGGACALECRGLPMLTCAVTWPAAYPRPRAADGAGAGPGRPRGDHPVLHRLLQVWGPAARRCRGGLGARRDAVSGGQLVL